MKTKIVLATHNQGKVKEISAMLGDLPVHIISVADAGFDDEIEETGATLEENALLKARTIREKINLPIPAPVLADDTGLEVDALNGAPGVRSARYAGERQSDADNRAKLLHALSGVPPEKRGAQFRCVLALIDKRGEHSFEGVCKGSIAQEEKGSSGFGYDAIFIPAGHQKTFAEMAAEEKNALSHRGKAVEALKRYLQKAGSY
ncbi:MAG TPA: XTP/dITP diphosphatase [Candidatus Kapabacteria bacterium]|nr:XTP/dITP diphosphatase [Candidatus Kapabacteria bacterium]